MTHDKAVELAHHAMINSKSRAHGLVDALIVLGLLDFVTAGEEQPSFEVRIDAAAKMLGSDPGITSVFLRCIDYAGLKLVPK